MTATRQPVRRFVIVSPSECELHDWPRQFIQRVLKQLTVRCCQQCQEQLNRE